MASKSKGKISTSSQGDRTVKCVRCSGDVAPYTGRAVSLLSNVYAHPQGKCADRAAQAAAARQNAVQGTLFGWSCAHVEPSYDGSKPECCTVTGSDRAEYVRHMRGHGKKSVTAEPKIRLRKSAPAAKLAPIAVPKPFKMMTWTEHLTTTTDSGGIYGTKTETAEVQRRGQYWSNGPDAHSVWAVTYTTYGTGQRPELVKLWVAADGSVTRDYSDAAWSRREAARQHRAATESCAA